MFLRLFKGLRFKMSSHSFSYLFAELPFNWSYGSLGLLVAPKC